FHAPSRPPRPPPHFPYTTLFRSGTAAASSVCGPDRAREPLRPRGRPCRLGRGARVRGQLLPIDLQWSTGRTRVRLNVWRPRQDRSEEHTSELQSLRHLVCRLLLE